MSGELTIQGGSVPKSASLPAGSPKTTETGPAQSVSPVGVGAVGTASALQDPSALGIPNGDISVQLAPTGGGEIKSFSLETEALSAGDLNEVLEGTSMAGRGQEILERLSKLPPEEAAKELMALLLKLEQEIGRDQLNSKLVAIEVKTDALKREAGTIRDSATKTLEGAGLKFGLALVASGITIGMSVYAMRTPSAQGQGQGQTSSTAKSTNTSSTSTTRGSVGGEEEVNLTTEDGVEGETGGHIVKDMSNDPDVNPAGEGQPDPRIDPAHQQQLDQNAAYQRTMSLQQIASSTGQAINSAGDLGQAGFTFAARQDDAQGKELAAAASVLEASSAASDAGVQSNNKAIAGMVDALQKMTDSKDAEMRATRSMAG